MKKINRYILLLLICFTSFNNVLAYTIPSGSYYVNVDTSSLGNIDIFIPADKIDYFIYDVEYQLINVGSSSITGYTHVGNTEYTITFPVFDEPYYRTSGYQNTNLNITDLISTNINFVSSNEQLFMNDTIFNKILFMTTCVGVFFLCLICYKK